MSKSESNGTLDRVRRAVAKLFSSSQYAGHDFDLARNESTVVQLALESNLSRKTNPDVLCAECAVHMLPSLRDMIGPQRNLASFISTVSRNESIERTRMASWHVPLVSEFVTEVHALGDWVLPGPGMHSPEWSLGRSAFAQSISCKIGGTRRHSVSVERYKKPLVRALDIGTTPNRNRRRGVLVHSDLNPIALVPLVRYNVKLMGTMRDAVMRLAKQGKCEVTDIQYLASFNGIPIGVVERLSVHELGKTVEIWLKAEALKGQSPTRVVTLIVGRNLKTNKLVQAVV